MITVDDYLSPEKTAFFLHILKIKQNVIPMHF